MSLHYRYTKQKYKIEKIKRKKEVYYKKQLVGT